MRVAVLYEASGRVRDAFTARGHDAISVDLRASASPGPHAIGDVLAWLRSDDARGLDLAIAHPSCRYLAVSGLHWNARSYGRHACTLHALDHVRQLMALLDAAGARWAIENPRSAIGSNIRKADQVIQPHNFGADASKETYLWLSRLPRLRATQRVPGRIVDDGRAQLGLFGTGVERWENQMDDGQNRLPETADRWAIRSETYPGVADAMAQQWGNL